MSEFNQYAAKLDMAFQSASEKQKKALDEYEDARQSVRLAKDSASKKKANENLKDVKHRLDGTQKSIWKEFRNTRDGLTQELKKSVSHSQTVNPDDLDQNAVELLNSNALKAADLEGMVTKYGDNGTMLKMISEKADALYSNEKDPGERSSLRMIKKACDKSPDTMKSWNDLCEISEHYSGENSGKKDPQYIGKMNQHWQDSNVQTALKNF